VERDELEVRIAEFAKWHYEFEFEGGVRTPLVDRRLVNRHEQRRRYFFEALVRLLGGSLKGHRVLDLGCNAGFWALHCIEAGADFVAGIDARAEFIDQAELVFAAKGIEPARYSFEAGNVFAHDLGEGFDVVLCLGLLDMVSKPVELFELMAGAGAQLIVLDTGLSRAASSFFEVSSLGDPRKAVDHRLTLVPTREAVIELAGEFGYDVVPLARNIADYAGMKDYSDGRRLAFFCSKGIPLQGLAVEPELPRGWRGLAADPRRALQQLRGG
jgi:SAM-dependent methyltransferase